jgi:monovalent cation/proton antiporter MnhG/PhaG subunit
MNVHMLLERGFLIMVMVFCWLGVLGMWRMREPMQALHYLSLPACGAMSLLTIAVFIETGNSQASWKTLLICAILFAINSVVTHATARAFRSREIGHWQALPGDSVEFVRDGRKK